MTSSRRDLPAFVLRENVIWEHRYLFLESLASEKASRHAVDDLRDNVYPIYIQARGDIGINVGGVSVKYEDNMGQIAHSSAFRSPFASFKHLCYAIETRQPGVDLDACSRLSAALLEWTKKLHLSPEFWTHAKEWLPDRIMFAFDNLFSKRGTENLFQFSTAYYFTDAPYSVTLEPKADLIWELSDESVAAFKKRAKRELDKQVNAIVNEAFKRAIPLLEPKGLVPIKRPQLLSRDMRWLIAYQCFEHSAERIADGEKAKTFPKAVEMAYKARAEEIGLVLRKSI